MDKQALLNIGKNNFVVASRILCITTFEAAAIKRFIQTAKENGLVLNSTCGRKTRSAILLDTGFVILSCVHPETLASRLKAKNSIRPRTKKLTDITDLEEGYDCNNFEGINDDGHDSIIDTYKNKNKNKIKSKNVRGRKNNINKKGDGNAKVTGKENV